MNGAGHSMTGHGANNMNNDAVVYNGAEFPQHNGAEFPGHNGTVSSFPDGHGAKAEHDEEEFSGAEFSQFAEILQDLLGKE